MTQTPTIRSVHAYRVWDSRGLPTVETVVTLSTGHHGRAIAPAGASRGSREATDLRDGGERLGGRDVSAAVRAVNDIIAPALVGMPISDQDSIDACLIELDGTPFKSKLGGNATVATSLAALHAGALDEPLWRHLANLTQNKPVLPLPEIQIFGGGAHAARQVDVQDFMVMVPGAQSFDEALEVTAEIYHAAGQIMAERGRLAGVADEGGWWPLFDSNEQALETLVEAIERAGETPGDRVVISLDIAASEFGKNGSYQLALDDAKMDSDALIEMLGRWLDRYPIVSIEDPLAEDDVAGMRAFTKCYGDRVQIIGDDYLVSNAELVKEASSQHVCNAVLIKVNQAGTVSEALAAMQAARAANWGTVVSARSGETEDVSICHLATGLNAGQLKVGSFARSERMIKWNECLRIGREIEIAGQSAQFAGGRALSATDWGRRHVAQLTP